jgi:hypothetical protein
VSGRADKEKDIHSLPQVLSMELGGWRSVGSNEQKKNWMNPATNHERTEQRARVSKKKNPAHKPLVLFSLFPSSHTLPGTLFRHQIVESLLTGSF